MKNCNKWTLVAVIAFFGIIVGITACDKDNGNEVEQPKNQSENVSIILGSQTYDFIIKGYLTDTEWGSGDTGVVAKVKTAIFATYNSKSEEPWEQAYMANLFWGGNVIIIVEKNPNPIYSIWKTIGDGKTLYLNYGALNNLSSNDLYNAFVSMENNETANNGTSPVSCNCITTYGQTDHLGIDETCNCPATVKPCGCTEQIGDVGGVPVRKEAGISVDDMDDAIENINTAYTKDSSAYRSPIDLSDIVAIHLTNGGVAVAYTESGILNIRLNTLDQVLEAELFYGIATDTYGPGFEYDGFIAKAK